VKKKKKKKKKKSACGKNMMRKRCNLRLQLRNNANPHFSRPVRNAHSVPTSVGVSRESIRPGKLLPEQLATGDLLTD